MALQLLNNFNTKAGLNAWRSITRVGHIYYCWQDLNRRRSEIAKAVATGTLTPN